MCRRELKKRPESGTENFLYLFVIEVVQPFPGCGERHTEAPTAVRFMGFGGVDKPEKARWHLGGGSDVEALATLSISFTFTLKRVSDIDSEATSLGK
jgi:hypothetical protein